MYLAQGLDGAESALDGFLHRLVVHPDFLDRVFVNPGGVPDNHVFVPDFEVGGFHFEFGHAEAVEEIGDFAYVSLLGRGTGTVFGGPFAHFLP